MLYAIVLYKDGVMVLKRPWAGLLSAGEKRALEYMDAHGADRVEVIDDATGILRFSHPKEPRP